MNGVKAIDVMNAAKATYDSCGDENYAKGKTNTFLRRCGAKLEDGPNQRLDMESIRSVVFAMLDSETEELFYLHLGRR